MTNKKELEKIVNKFTNISMTLKCTCGKPVARISLKKDSEKHAFHTEHNFSLRYKKFGDEYSGMNFEIESVDNLVQIRSAMKNRDITVLREVEDANRLGDLMEGDGYCKECNQMYCKGHSSTRVIDPHQGDSLCEYTCPKGHKWNWYY